MLDGSASCRVGFGTAPVAIEGRPTWTEALGVVAAAFEAGVAIIDTADAYCLDSSVEHHYGERLVASAAAEADGEVAPMVATKVGERRPGDGSWQLRGDPGYLASTIRESLRALGTDHLDLLQLHRPDPSVPLAESVGALADAMEAGLARHIGVCNVTAAELRVAMSTARISTVQNRLSVLRPTAQDEVISICESSGLTFLAHSPFGGPGSATRLGTADRIARVARRHDSSSHAVALAWLLHRSPVVVPIPGTTRAARVRENLGACTIDLDEADLSSLAA